MMCETDVKHLKKSHANAKQLLIMSDSSLSPSPTRSSRRLQGKEPEYGALEEELTPKKIQKYATRNTLKSIPHRGKRHYGISEEGNSFLQEENEFTSSEDDEDYEGGSVADDCDWTAGNSSKLKVKYLHIQNIHNIQRDRLYINPYVPIMAVLFPIMIIIGFCIITAVNISNSKSLFISSFPSLSKDFLGLVDHGMQNTQPFVLLLVHSDNQDSGANCLAKRTAEIVGSAREKTSVMPIVIDGKDTKEDSNFVSNLRSKMEREKTKAVVFLNVDELPATIAADLHFVLDIYSPWMDGGVFVLTLNIPSLNANEKPFEAVRKYLSRKWHGQFIEENIEPLIARIGSFVTVVKDGDDPCSKH